MKKFVTTVKEHKGFMKLGRILSKELIEFIGKKVKVTIEETK